MADCRWCPTLALECGDTAPVMVGGEMCGGVRLVAHNLGLGTGTPSGSLAPALAPPQLILTTRTLAGPCCCCYKCSPISLQRRPGWRGSQAVKSSAV